VNSDGIPYSVLGGGFAVERVAGFVWARTRAVIIEEINVSNGPESGHPRGAGSCLSMAAMCHEWSFGFGVPNIPHELHASDYEHSYNDGKAGNDIHAYSRCCLWVKLNQSVLQIPGN
jgi:hypothetical protein